VRIHEAVGSSKTSWAAAVADAVRAAKKEAPQPIAVEVVRLWGDLGGKAAISLYRASVKIAFKQELSKPRR